MTAGRSLYSVQHWRHKRLQWYTRQEFLDICRWNIPGINEGLESLKDCSTPCFPCAVVNLLSNCDNVAIDNLNRENTMSIMYGSHHFHSSDARDKERNESKVRCWCRSIYGVLGRRVACNTASVERELVTPHLLFELSWNSPSINYLK
jgi:hypothetical protein